VKKASQKEGNWLGREDGWYLPGRRYGGSGPAAGAFIIPQVCAGELEKMRLEKEVRPDSQRL